MLIPNESRTDDFGLLGWLMFLVFALGLMAAVLADHVQTHGSLF